MTICISPGCDCEATRKHQLCDKCYFVPAIHRAARNGDFPPKERSASFCADSMKCDAVPPHSECIITSTPSKVDNPYYEMFADAAPDSCFRPSVSFELVIDIAADVAAKMAKPTKEEIAFRDDFLANLVL